MNGKLAKKIRKAAKRNWMEYLSEIKAEPFIIRWRYAWWVVFGKKRKV